MKRGGGRIRGRLKAFFFSFAARVRANRLSFVIYALMGLITATVIVLTFLGGQYESTFTAVLSLFLFLLPTLISEGLRIKLPEALEIIAVLFVFCANILGEIFSFYTLLPFWDDMLHYTSGFIFAAFGFSGRILRGFGHAGRVIGLSLGAVQFRFALLISFLRRLAGSQLLLGLQTGSFQCFGSGGSLRFGFCQLGGHFVGLLLTLDNRFLRGYGGILRMLG
jgi:hypothetical protein